MLDENGNATRSGLWFEMLRIISEARPRFVVAENVRGAINAALDTVTRGLAGGGYEVRTVVIPASAVGAPHQRERLFILGIRGDIADMCTKRISGGGTVFCASEVADAGVEGLQGRSHPGDPDSQGEEPDDKQSCGRRPGVWRTPDAHADRGAMSEALYQERIAAGKPININAQVAHCERTGSTQYREGSMHSANLGQIDDLAERTEGNGVKGQLNPDWVEELMGYPRGWTDLDRDEPGIWMGWPARPGEPQYPYEHPRTVVGMKDRAKRLKALGNAVVPQQAEPIFRAVQIIDKLTR